MTVSKKNSSSVSVEKPIILSITVCWYKCRMLTFLQENMMFLYFDKNVADLDNEGVLTISQERKCLFCATSFALHGSLSRISTRYISEWIRLVSEVGTYSRHCLLTNFTQGSTIQSNKSLINSPLSLVNTLGKDLIQEVLMGRHPRVLGSKYIIPHRDTVAGWKTIHKFGIKFN